MSVLRAKNRKPLISFGLGKTTLTATLGSEIIVWQSTIYNDTFYDGNISGEEITFENISLNQYKITCDTIGEFNVQVQIDSVSKRIKLLSNIIKLKVE